MNPARQTLLAPSSKIQRTSRALSTLVPRSQPSHRRPNAALRTHPHTRPFTTTRPTRLASLAQHHPPTQPTVLLSHPTREDLDDEEIDAEVIPRDEAKIHITERAAEQLRSITQRQNNPEAALRIAVESGGCHGYQYQMELATHRGRDDYHFTHPSIRPSNLLIDAVSLSLLNGATIDFATELIGSSFRILDNPHAQGSGCGCGVSWELKI